MDTLMAILELSAWGCGAEAADMGPGLSDLESHRVLLLRCVSCLHLYSYGLGSPRRPW